MFWKASPPTHENCLCYWNPEEYYQGERMPLIDCTRVKISEATKPHGGCYFIYENQWWVVTPDEEILFYRKTSPQCNDNQKIAESIRDKLYPGFDVRQIPFVYLEHNSMRW